MFDLVDGGRIVATITFEVPEKLLVILKERAKSEGKIIEELISEAVLKYYDLGDPGLKAEIYLKLCQKYLMEGEKLLKEKDYVQASEKFWGSATQIVKAIAAERGLELRSHDELHSFILKLEKEAGNPDIRRLWQSAGMLHQNFYENWLPPEMVEENAEDVKKLINIIKNMLKL
jgi:hypothetical protein